MKYAILPLLLVFSYLDASGIILQKRKIKIENRFLQIGKVYKGLPSSETDADYKKLEDTLKKLDDSFQTGEREKRGPLLTESRLTLKKIEKGYSQFLDNEAKELISLYVVNAREKLSIPNSNKKKLTPETKEKIEKANRAEDFFRMAKRERSAGHRYTTNRNYFFSIHQFKRSIEYSIKAMQEAGVDVPEKYSKAAKEWSGKGEETAASGGDAKAGADKSSTSP
ncbi:MAG: hypothetical protein AAF518_08075 [Spirochaetota bacterium]